VVAKAGIDSIKMIKTANKASFKYLAGRIDFMKPKFNGKDDIWSDIKKRQKDPEFVKAARRFIKLTTS